ncbi:3-oxoacyl-[acyl-carrier-protein] synthase 3 [Pseudomonas putida]|uniref:Ketoacyl-ACP synthase III n=1 Tax=Pseudomonas guariconensis TaxID=1288410 RepID=A0AAX0VZC5_9PSED|nr:ketoacyl-ACP synthase III [Pseudomonas guariconensis]CAB5525329.1 3-oxoacyl-[acyl-carrier-protein] synthase 3 [Pseudomonas putida]PLV20082.1 ketoacyl-ACP synthase III [Pseudomonas guariconensis]PLV25662.1 ketoacyl-ACP synthase III [Pseudomonas guariconensis]PLV30759.1 ketoacyl-ACP synthase III [Pseudomonas guariconensis]CAB5530455.1 3-oxoacyl-[acyl-carrier-protein] synthase 3 [Pseudomonas putida]
MIGIKSIASYVPVEGVDNYAQGAKFGKDQEFIFGKIGSTFLPRKDASQETSDLCVEAAKALFAANPTFDPASIEALIVVTQNGDAEGLPHTAAIVQQKLGLPTHIAAFDISLGCSGYVYGIYALKGFMETAGFKNGLLITADPYSKIVDPEDRNTTMLFGDAATATWMGEGATWQLGKSLFGSDGAGAEHLRTTDGKFFMNGRQVYNFALVKVPAHLQQLLEASGLQADDIDLYCLHQGSAAIVDAVSQRFNEGKQREKFVKDMAETGNTVSSSIPLLLEKYVLDSHCKRVALSGFGVGLSWGSAILERTD